MRELHTVPRPPWTVRAVQVGLCVVAVLVAATSALVAFLLLVVGVISLDGRTPVESVAICAGAAAGILAAGIGATVAILLVSRSLGRGSHRAWAATLGASVVSAVLLAGAGDAWAAVALGLPPRLTAVVAASPPALAALLLIAPATLRALFSAPRRGVARPLARPQVAYGRRRR